MTQSIILRCVSCGAKNKVPEARLNETPMCGKCSAALDISGVTDTVPRKATDRTFDAMVMKSPLPVLVDFWAPWCGPCRMVGPVLDELAAQWQGRARIIKVNVDENQGLAAKYGAKSIPTLMIFDNGALKDTAVGALPKHEIEKRMARFLYG